MLTLEPGTIEIERDGRTYTRVAVTRMGRVGKCWVVGYRPWMRSDKPSGSVHAMGLPDGCAVVGPVTFTRSDLAKLIRHGRRLGYRCRISRV